MVSHLVCASRTLLASSLIYSRLDLQPFCEPAFLAPKLGGGSTAVHPKRLEIKPRFILSQPFFFFLSYNRRVGKPAEKRCTVHQSKCALVLQSRWATNTLHTTEIDRNGQTDLFAFFELKIHRLSFSRVKIFLSLRIQIQLHISYKQLAKLSNPYSFAY